MKVISFYQPKYNYKMVNSSSKKCEAVFCGEKEDNDTSDVFLSKKSKDKIRDFLIYFRNRMHKGMLALLNASLHKKGASSSEDSTIYENLFDSKNGQDEELMYQLIALKYSNNPKLVDAIKFYKPDFNCEYMQNILNAKKENGELLFSAENLAGIINAQSTIGLDIEDEETKNHIFNKFVEEIRECTDEQKDFICEHFNKSYLYGVDIIKKLMEIGIFKGKEEMGLTGFIISQNEVMQNYLYASNQISIIDSPKYYDYINDCYKDYIDSLIVKYFLTINEYNVNQDIKIKLCSNTDYFSEENLKKTKNIINSIALCDLAKCDDDNLAGIITLLGSEYSHNASEENLAEASAFHKLNSQMNADEHKLFDEKIKEKYCELMHYIERSKNYMPVAKEDIRTFFYKFIFDAQTVGGEKVDEIVSSKDFDNYLEKCQKTGIKLAFSKEEFVKQLYNMINSPSEEKAEIIQKKLGIQLTNFPVGYNGIMTIDNLDENDADEKKIKELIQRFFYENEVVSDNPKISETLNLLIKAFPEFLNTVGKIQHDIHKYTVDIHTLKLLRNALLDKDYKKLNIPEKMCTKFAILFHDIGKNTGVVDEEHPEKSADIVKSILSKVNLNISTKNRIVELIRNHHWFKLANSPEDNKEKMQKIATMFRRENDLIIAKIIGAADINSVNDLFPKIVRLDEMPKTISKIKALQNKMHTLGNFAYSTQIFSGLFKEKTKIKYTRNGNEYNLSVLNFANKKPSSENIGFYIDKNMDLRKLGFINSFRVPTFKKDLSFLLHCTDLPMSIYFMNDIASDMNLCASSVTLGKMATYINKPYGVIFASPDQNNVGATYIRNQNSGSHKSFDEFANEIWQYADERKNYYFGDSNPAIFRRKYFMQYFEDIGIKLSKDEYGQIHRVMVTKNSLDKIHDICLRTGRILKEKDIKDAIDYTDRKLREFYQYTHNEINLYSPQVLAIFARENSLDDVPITYIRTAEELKLPIFLFGKSNKNSLHV